MNQNAPQVSPAAPPEETEQQLTGAAVTKADLPGAWRLRLWPGVVIVGLQWLVILGPDYVVPGTMIQFQCKLFGALGATVAIAVWWLFASGAPRLERFLLLGVCVLVAAGSLLFNALPVQVFLVFALPWVPTAWVGSLLLTSMMPWWTRRAALISAVALTSGFFALVRFEGIDGGISPSFQWRWAQTAEAKLLAEIDSRKATLVAPAPATAPLTLQAGDWPAFRGPSRDGRVSGVRIRTNWQETPPPQLWRHRVGPGWSSFAVVGPNVYTQEQRGEFEAVVCYRADTGDPVWEHQDPARFNDVPSGAGPRATPTFHDGKIFAVGATGLLTCLDAASGRLIWQRNLLTDSGAKLPQFGYCASPLVTQEKVIVFAGSAEGKSVAAYHIATGEPAWLGGNGLLTYCSPQPARLDALEQVLLTTEHGLMALDAASGSLLWQHAWPETSVAPRVVQPALIENGDILIGTGSSGGTRRLRVQRTGDQWEGREVWTSRALKPFFNDMVVHRDHVYGFDGTFLTCVNLQEGKAKWRARGYGSGQVLLLADQDLLLVLCEEGAIALVQASPEGHNEIARFQAIAGKTWNHPVVAHGRLFVRNGEEAACFQLKDPSQGEPNE
jgi:outer membrane protein assembly factor BamB